MYLMFTAGKIIVEMTREEKKAYNLSCSEQELSSLAFYSYVCFT